MATKVNLIGINELDLTSTGGTVTATLTSPGVVAIDIPGGGGGGVTRGPLNTNTSGNWWVWSDGVIEQWGSITIPPTSSNLASGVIAFPTNFLTGVTSIHTEIVGLPRSGSSDVASSQINGFNLNNASVNLQCNVPTGGGGATFDQAVKVYWRAIGS